MTELSPEFVAWARRIAGALDLDEVERRYKLAYAKRLAGVRRAVLDDAPGWPVDLRKAVGGSNLVNMFFLMRLNEALVAEPHRVRTAVLTLWADDTPDAARIDDFSDAIDKLSQQVTPGNKLSLASALLMAREPTDYPPYRAEASRLAYRLAGYAQAPKGAGLAAVYEHLLGFFDVVQKIVPGMRDRLDAQGLMWATLKIDPPSADQQELERLHAWRGVKPPAPDIVAHGDGKAPTVEAAAWYILERGLTTGQSALDPSIRSWTVDNARELIRRVEEEADTGAGTFLQKLKGQLEGADRGVSLLAAELLLVQMLPLTNVSEATKRSRIATALSWLDDPPELPPEIDRALSARGAFNGGVGFNVQLWQHLVWLCHFVAHWWSQDEATRAEALGDPWAFRAVVASNPMQWQSIRNSLLYLAWPGYFESLVNQDHKRLVREAFADRIGGPSGKDDEAIDRDLYAIRQVIDAEAGDLIDWYHEPYYSQWHKSIIEGRRAWLVRPGHSGHPLIRRWRHESFVSLSATYLAEVEAGAPLATVRRAVEQGYQHLDYAQRLAVTNEYFAFLTTMSADDLVMTIADDLMWFGAVLDEPVYANDESDRLRRGVAWSQVPVPLSAAASPIPALLDQQGTVVDLTGGLDALRAIMPSGDEPGAEGDEAPAPVLPLVLTVPELAAASDQLAAALHFHRGWLQTVIDLLQDRHQIVLYGPPGTGKTYTALRIARHLSPPEAVRLVQFHPSYSYEDFFEGIRPVTVDGQVEFHLRAGPLRQLAAAAAQAPDVPHFLIIDEINRANLAKVFGELYFLLEYRQDSVQLQYSPDQLFRLPLNVFVIGTMNTADRSIALVDSAIRRRFAFVEMHPAEDPVKGLLNAWLAANHWIDDERAPLLEALNEAIGEQDRDLHIGPSYLMKADAERDLDRVWEYSILPLLEEHYYGRKTRKQIRSEFGLASLRKRISRASPSSTADAGTALPGDTGESADPIIEGESA